MSTTTDSKGELNETLNLLLSTLVASGRAVTFDGGGITLSGTGTITNDDGNPVNPPTILGIGTNALVGNDLTDLGNNGVEGSYNAPSNLAGFDGVFFANLKPNFGSFQAAFNVFDNRAGGASDDKALWGFPATPDQLQLMIVGANFATTHGPRVLTSFTLTSGEDTPERDPTVAVHFTSFV